MRIRPVPLRNNRGNFVAWFFVIVVLLTFSIFVLVLNKTWSSMEAPLAEQFSENMPTDNTDVNVTKILGQVGSTTVNFSKMLPFLIIGLFAFILIGAGAIMKHPIMIFVGLIILGIIILLAVIFSNVYTGISESDGFTDTDAKLGLQGKFMDYLPTIVVLLALGVFAAILYGKSQGGGQL